MKRHLLVVGIIFLFISSVVAPITIGINADIPIETYIQRISSDGMMTVIKVDDDGDGDYNNIQEAVNNATSGDIIEVYSGTYMETDIIVDKQLILQGVDSELGEGSGVGKPLIINSEEDKKVILVTSDACRISGFIIKSTGCCSWGIYLFQSNNTQVYQNEIDNINFGIYLRESLYNKVYKNEVSETQQAISNSYISNNNLIYDNNIYDNGYGIFISNYAENITVYNNTVSNINAIGIKSSKSNNNTIHGNIITACNQGIGLWMEDYYGNKNTIYKNLITSCGRGISVTGKDHKIYNNSIFNCKYGLYMETLLPSSLYCSKNTVYENNINSCDTGIRLDIVYTTDIYWNNITECKSKGLFLEESEVNNIFENNVTYNDHGIYLLESEGNVIYHNNFIGNTENAWCWGHTDRWNQWNLDLTKDGGGNYWDDYQGKDRNGDNVGDRPYIIPDFDENPFNNNKDKYPLMEPNGRPNVKVKSICGRLYVNQFLLHFLERYPLLNQFLQRLTIL